MTVPELYMVIAGLVLFIIGMLSRDLIFFTINHIVVFCYTSVLRINHFMEMWNDPLRCYYCGRHARWLEESSFYFSKQFCDFGEYKCDITRGPKCEGHQRRLCSFVRHLGEREVELVKNVQRMEREGLTSIPAKG